MHLELADNDIRASIPEQTFYNMMGQNQPKDNPYLWVPSGLIEGYDNVYVNEKEFDALTELEWHTMMTLLEPHQPGAAGMGFWPVSTKRGRKRRADRRAIRQAKKIETIKTRAAAGTGISGAIKNIASIFAPAPALPGVEPGFPQVAPGVMIGPAPTFPAVPPTIPEGYMIDPTTGQLVKKEKEKTWFDKNWGWVVGGGVVLIGGIVAVGATTRRRRRRAA